MTLTDQQRKEFEALARPLIQWLNDNCHPHVEARVTPVSAELSEGVFFFPTDEYVKD